MGNVEHIGSSTEQRLSRARSLGRYVTRGFVGLALVVEYKPSGGILAPTAVYHLPGGQDYYGFEYADGARAIGPASWLGKLQVSVPGVDDLM